MTAYQIWSPARIPDHPTIMTAVPRDNRIYLSRESAEKAQEQFGGEKTYLVEYLIAE